MKINSSMKFSKLKIGVLVCLLWCFPKTVLAEDNMLVDAYENTLPEWSFSGQNTLKMEEYVRNGKKSGSPYPFVGFQLSNDYNLNAKRKISPYEDVEIQAFGVINDSEYRSTENGMVLERGKIQWQKGDANIPLKMEVGDFFGQQTSRTLQRSLKGIQLELQPEFNVEGQEHSIQFFSGVSKGAYRDLEKNVELFSGASWLMQDKQYGSFTFTTVHNYKENTLARNIERNQVVSSLAWGRKFQLYNLFQFEAEGELAKSFSDAGTNGTGREDDKGIFGQINGKMMNLPLTYRIRYEYYGDDFRPGGATISSDQETKEAHLGWRFDNGMQVRTRLQRFTTNVESSNTTDTDVWGLNVNGPLWDRGDLGAITGQVDFFTQGVETRRGLSTNNQTQNINASLNVPVVRDVTFRPGMVLTFAKNQNTNVSTANRQFSSAVDYSFTTAGLNGTVSPSLTYQRNASGAGTLDENVNPSLSLFLANQVHSLRMSYNAQVQNAFGSTSAIDSTTQQSSLNYVYTWKQHQFGLEANQFSRDPRPGLDSDAYRVGLSWTFNFDRLAKAAVQTTDMAVAPRETGSGPLRMIDLPPGGSLKEAQAILQAKGFRSPVERAGLFIYEGRFLNSIERRQRLGLLTTGNRIDQSVLVIDFQAVGDVDSVSQTFERVRKIMNQRYGSPNFFIEEGNFSNNLSNDLTSGSFKRIVEWTTPYGRLRFGIPRRTDGLIRIEIQHAKTFPPVANSNWSIEQLR
ncbi:MAG: hypothetical protein COV66_07540 [Nitrospinae bacterium CG11_big_fil_rev_8_21_14_0_20_45_15]|nr:MAG: hypothetical protein COV66_07540 [Nitrospinae bacterium CG11_big_fil_rev_8_21_14_0_20_45_15]